MITVGPLMENVIKIVSLADPDLSRPLLRPAIGILRFETIIRNIFITVMTLETIYSI